VTKVSRDQLIEVLWAENILARRYFYPGCHRMEPYRTLFPDAGLMLPETEKVANRVIVLPTGTAMNIERIAKLCAIMRTVVSNGNAVREKLDGQALGVAQ
jgi:dTDP-4-amino-4,6-dideoxygalactose transaminase